MNLLMPELERQLRAAAHAELKPAGRTWLPSGGVIMTAVAAVAAIAVGAIALVLVGHRHQSPSPSSAAANPGAKSPSAAGDPRTIYTINASTLTITSTNPVLLHLVRGSQLMVSCQSTAKGNPGTTGFGQWGQRAFSATIHLRADISKSVAACETSGDLRGSLGPAAEFSRVGFTPQWRQRFASTPPPARWFAQIQLTQDWAAMHQFLPPTFMNQQGILISLPPPATLVQMLKGPFGRSGATLLYARTLAGAIQQNVSYVIGQASSKTRLELAVRGLDSTLYIFRGKVGNYVGGSFGPAP